MQREYAGMYSWLSIDHFLCLKEPGSGSYAQVNLITYFPHTIFGLSLSVWCAASMMNDPFSGDASNLVYENVCCQGISLVYFSYQCASWHAH